MKAIKCDRCGKLEEPRYDKEERCYASYYTGDVTGLEISVDLWSNVDLCDSCRGDVGVLSQMLAGWWRGVERCE